MVRSAVSLHTALYRLTAGRFLGHIGRAPLVLLTTRGRKSGRLRTLPLIAMVTDRGWAVVASYAGSDRHPAWYSNLVAHPEVEVDDRGRRLRALASTVDADRHAELWPRLVELYPDYQIYQQRTERRIPVVELVPITES